MLLHTDAKSALKHVIDTLPLCLAARLWVRWMMSSIGALVARCAVTYLLQHTATPPTSLSMLNLRTAQRQVFTVNLTQGNRSEHRQGGTTEAADTLMRGWRR